MTSSSNADPAIGCGVPLRHSTIQLAHGGGGRAMHELIERVFLPAFAAPEASQRHDSAVLPRPPGRLAFTSDSYVIRPLCFPGGDIGSLAVNGTLNDLAMSGARPRFLSASFVLEEGLELALLERIVASMAHAARSAGVSIVTGDTKVVDRGHGDGIYISTAGIGDITDGIDIAPRSIRPGDVILVSGDIGRHGVAVLSVREGLGFESELESDCRELSSLVQTLLGAGVVPHCLRDLTRGGLAAALIELATSAALTFELGEAEIPISDAVRGASELLGLDPLYIACEGRFVAFLAEEDAERAVSLLRAAGAEPIICGRVRAERGGGSVELRAAFGGSRTLELFYGEQLPRIC